MKDNTKKKKGPIRYEAILPVLILSLITFLYFSYYFDKHLERLIEFVGTQANGAEVDVASVKTSFIHASFDLNKLEVTDKERPTHNILEIENMHFQYLWDALLRMKFVVEDASINNIQMSKPRTSPGKVLPPEPAKPSKLNELQNEVVSQVKNKYNANMLGDIVTILEGGDYKDKIQEIRGSLKSEERAHKMVEELKAKKQQWSAKVTELSDPSKLKEVEAEIQKVSQEKNFVNQAKEIPKLTNLLSAVQKQYKSIQDSSKQLQSELAATAKFPHELEDLVNQDIASLKGHFSIPQLDFKDMAMHLFAGEFVEYIAKARKYQALAKQYMPEKKKEEENVLPHKRSEGKNYHFPITTGYPLFWLKRAALSSKGTADTYSGNVSGELTNVTTSPKLIGKPIILDMRGDFPAAKVAGLKAVITLDHTREIPKQSAMIHVDSFAVPEKIFVQNDKLTMGFKDAIATSTVTATLVQEHVDMKWTSAFNQPHYVLESPNKIAKEMLTNILNGIPQITLNGTASGSFSNLSMHINSNLGEELATGLKTQLGLKVAEAQDKLKALVDEKVNRPKQEVQNEVGANQQNLSQLENLQALYKKNEEKIKAEIDRLKKGGGGKTLDDLKEKGKNILKGFKF